MINPARLTQKSIQFPTKRTFLSVSYTHLDVYKRQLPNSEEIELQEHIPVSELDDVKVALDAKATPGYELRAADGIVSYKLRLAPGEKRAVELHYYVDAPASMLGE